MRRSGFDSRSAYVRFVVNKMALWQVFFRVLQFYPLRIIPTKLYTHLHLCFAFTRKTNGSSLGTFQEVKFFRKCGTIGYKNRLTLIFSVLRGLKAGEPFIFTIQDVRYHHPCSPVDCFLLSRHNSNLHCQIISDNHNWTAIYKNSRYHLRDVTLCEFVTHYLAMWAASERLIRNLSLRNDQYTSEQWTRQDNSFV